MITRTRRTAVAVLLVLAGCTHGPAPADQYDQEGPIVFVDGPDTTHGRQLAQLVEAWNRMHSDERVTFTELPPPTDEHRAQLRARAQDLANAEPGADPGQCYDVVTLDVIWTTEFAERGYLVPLDPREFGADRLLPESVAAATVDGRLWAIPQRTDAGLLYYREDLVQTPPDTWDELVAKAKTARDEHGVDGYVGQFDRYEGLTVNALEVIWGMGGDVLAPDGTVLAGEREARAGVRLLADGVKDGWISDEALGYDEERSRQAFQDGTAMFLRNWPYAHRLLAADESPVAKTFGVARLPGPAALGGWNLGISSCSPHRRTARDFIEFLTSEKNQRILFRDAGFGPTIESLYEDRALREEFPHLEVLYDSIRNSKRRPVTPDYEDVSDAIQQHVGDVLANPASVDDRTQDLAERLTELTAR